VRNAAIVRAYAFASSNEAEPRSGTTTWIPFAPEVFGNEANPCPSRTLRSVAATRQVSRSPAGSPGSRSNTSRRGVDGSSAVNGNGWISIVPRFAIHSRDAVSSTTQ